MEYLKFDWNIVKYCALFDGYIINSPWFGLRENLQETIDFPINMGLSCNLSLKPFH